MTKPVVQVVTKVRHERVYSIADVDRLQVLKNFIFQVAGACKMVSKCKKTQRMFSTVLGQIVRWLCKDSNRWLVCLGVLTPPISNLVYTATECLHLYTFTGDSA